MLDYGIPFAFVYNLRNKVMRAIFLTDKKLNLLHFRKQKQIADNYFYTTV